MQIAIRFFIVSILFIFSPYLWAGTQYYCDPINGNNNNSGSRSQPLAAFSSVNWQAMNLQAGDTIYLLNGQHGRAYLNNLQPTNYVTIQALSGHNPVLTSVELRNSRYLKFSQLMVDASEGDFTKESPIFAADKDSHYIVVENTTVQAAEHSADWTKSDWYNNTTSGFQFRGMHITLRGNLIKNTYHALEVRGNYSTVSYNTIDNFAGDAIRGLGSFSSYENNVIQDCYIDDYNIQHDDGFQAYNLAGDGKIESVVIRNNKFFLFTDPVTAFVQNNQLIGTLMQGIIITDGYADNWIVENNLVVNNMDHGISLYGVRNSRVQNNTVVQSALFTDTDHVPRIMLTDQSKTGQSNFNNIIRNNLAALYTTWTFDESSLVEHNTKIDPSAYANYFAYFVDYERNDFHLAPQSPAIDAGINKNLTATDLDGKGRVSNALVDAGAFEYHDSNSDGNGDGNGGNNGDSCASEFLLKDFQHQALWQKNMKHFRDKTLRQSATGQRLIILYYQNSGELKQLMAQDIVLKKMGVRLLLRSLTAFSNKQNNALIPLDDIYIKHAIAFLARAQAKGSDAMQQDFEEIKTILIPLQGLTWSALLQNL